MGRQDRDRQDDKDRRERDKRITRSPGNRKPKEKRKMGKGDRKGPSSFHWHNHSRRERTPASNRPPVASHEFRVETKGGGFIDIPKDSLKYTETEPCLAYSTRQTPKEPLEIAPSPPPPNEPKDEETKTPEKLLEQLNFNNNKRPDQETHTPPKQIPIKTSFANKSEKEGEVPQLKSKTSITINLADLLPTPTTPNPVLPPSEDEAPPTYDIFGEDPLPTKKKWQKVKKIEFPKTSLPITSLYDEEDEDDLVPTNALRIGSNQIKPIHTKKEHKKIKVELEKEKTPPPPPDPVPPPVDPPKPVVTIKEEPLELRLYVPVVAPVPAPSSLPLDVPIKKESPMEPLDLLKTLDSESTEVDDFLQQIQEQRQRIEEKFSNSQVSPKKVPQAPVNKFKFLIDIDSVQKEINDKLEEMPDDYLELPTIPLQLDLKKVTGIRNIQSNNLANKERSNSESSASSSSSSSSSATSSSEDNDSSSSSSDEESSSTSSSSESSHSSEQQENEEEVKKEEENSLRIAAKPLRLEVDLTLASRSPVMLKIQPKPRVIPILQAALGDEEEPVAEKLRPLKDSGPPSTEKAPSHRRERRRTVEDRDRRKESRSSSYDRSHSSGKRSSRRSDRGRSERRRSRDVRDVKSERSTKKERSNSRKSSSYRGRRSRSKSISPVARSRHHDSRSRSRSLSVEEQGGSSRKRSPWRPPIDFWENLNVPTNSWAYNNEQYFSRAYYDESYNYFEQNQIQQHGGGGGVGGDGVYGDVNVNAHQNWLGPGQSHRDMVNGGAGGSPMRDSLDDRINNVLNGGPVAAVAVGAQEAPYNCYGGNNNSGQGQYGQYSGPPQQVNNFYNQPVVYGNSQMGGGGDQYRQSANLLSINCTEGPPAPFALQKGNVIELVPSHVEPHLSSSGYQSVEREREEQQQRPARTKCSSSGQRKQVREKKRMEKNMRKKKLEMELQHLLEDGSPDIELNLEGEKKPSPKREEVVRKVIFSDGVLPGDGTSDSVMDSSDDSNTDLAELTSNQLKKYRKKKRKKRSMEKSSATSKNQEAGTTTPVVADEPAKENGLAEDGPVVEDTEKLPLPPPPPNDPPSHLVQPQLKREVMERPKKLLYFNTCHRERRMDFFSIFVPFSMFIRLNDPRLMQGHPMIVNRRRIPQPIYPPNMYPPPPQPFQHLPPVQISGAMPCGMQSTVAVPPPPPPAVQIQPQGIIPVAVPTGPIRHIPTIGDN